MTPSTISLRTEPEDHHVAQLAAAAIALALAEAAIPSPLPGVKPGLANIVTLFVLYRYGFRLALWVTALRVVAGSLLLGTFLSPSFILSLSGAAASLAVLLAAQRLPAKWFGPVTLSLASAFAHLAGQLTVVHWWLIPQTGIVYLVPIFGASALLFGTLNGVVVARLLASRHPLLDHLGLASPIHPDLPPGESP